MDYLVLHGRVGSETQTLSVKTRTVETSFAHGVENEKEFISFTGSSCLSLFFHYRLRHPGNSDRRLEVPPGRRRRGKTV